MRLLTFINDNPLTAAGCAGVLLVALALVTATISGDNSAVRTCAIACGDHGMLLVTSDRCECRP